MSHNLLMTEQLSFNPNGKQLLTPTSLEFTPGKLIGILGPNGAGKSTLLKTICGIWKPSSGRVIWNGEDLLQKTRIEISKTISLVPQTTHIPFEFSVYEFVMMGRYPHGRCRLVNYDHEIIEWALQIVDAWSIRKRRMNELSHGERQRCYIARALSTESPVLFLDEPTASLDIRHQLEIWACLCKLVDQGKIIVVTSHDLIATERFCNQVMIMHQGSCIACGSFAETVQDLLLKEVFGVAKLTSQYAIA